MRVPIMAGTDQSTDAANPTVLLDIVQSLGRVEGQNALILQEQARAADGRKAQYQALDEIRARTQTLESKLDAVSGRVTTIEPDVKNMKAFRAQLSLAVFYVTAAVTGAINLVWYAVTHLGEIKTAIREFLK
jgi:hypothetical protein